MKVWIGKQPCGCVVAAITDKAGCEADLGDMLRQGLIVEAVEGPVKLPTRCDTCRAKVTSLGWPDSPMTRSIP